MSLGVLFHFVGGGDPVVGSIPFLDAGTRFRLEVGQNVDGLTAAMFIVVTTVSLLVQVYSVGYMHGDRRYTFFFAALSLFTAAMLAWGATTAADQGVRGTGTLGPVQAFGLAELTAGAAAAGLVRT